jgi:hypothetical protein
MIREIWLSEGATDHIGRAAVRGYEARYKEERLGILLGNISDGIARVEQAIVYRGGVRTRTMADIGDSLKYERRVRALQKETGWNYLGGFHTHNEVAGSHSSAPSQEDKTPLCDNLKAYIELIASIRATDSPMRSSQRYLKLDYGPYQCRVAAYGYLQGFRFIPVYSDVG